MPPRNRQHAKSKRDVIKEIKHPVYEDSHDVKVVTGVKVEKSWTPSTYTAFKVLLSARLCAAVWSNISDCDEVFNYWEPTHFLLYGKGFQTWEYSPIYAIRSYAYLWIHAAPGYIYKTLLQSNKVLVFYFLRCLLGFCSALCEVYFYRAICYNFGLNIGRLALVFLAVGSGMFISSSAFLPSSFSMYLVTIAFASWFLQKYEMAVFATAASALIGWPFVAILGLPIAYDIVILKKKLELFFKWSFLSLFAIMVPMILLDTRHFGRFVVAPLNIVMYNVFTSHGPDLYGTEPCTFYFLNGFLNFNVVFLFALTSAPIMALSWYFDSNQRKSAKPSMYLSIVAMYLWMFVFFPLAHKEERFLFPIYTLICLVGAFTVDSLQKSFHALCSKKNINNYSAISNWIIVILCIFYTILSMSRTIIVYRGYRAPLEIFMEFGKFSTDEELHIYPPNYPVNVCIGKEWYRFPSSFFLPENWSLKFVQSDFKGQLPKEFSSSANATKIIPSDMNDQNLEEKSRYVNIKNCDYLVDSNFPSSSPLEPKYSEDSNNWKIVYTIPFLDAQRCHRILRAFYVPYLTDYECQYIDYNLLQRVNLKNRFAKRRYMENGNKVRT